jgi:MoxR-like ATPase
MRSDEGTDGRRLVLVHGVPGSGKSTLAAALAVELGWSLGRKARSR